MKPVSIETLMRSVQCSISITDLNSILTTSPYHCFFIKNQQSNYVFANDNFISLMGLSNLSQLKVLSDQDMSKNKQDAKKYRALDCEVLESKKRIEVCEILTPEYNPTIIKTMSGSLIPMLADNGKCEYILGLVAPKNQLLKLTWESVFALDITEISQLLIKKRYEIRLAIGQIHLSKMEILSLIELVKGKHAGEMARSLGLKQNTVESYISNIKNKCGVNSKSELINILITQQVFNQVML